MVCSGDYTIVLLVLFGGWSAFRPNTITQRDTRLLFGGWCAQTIAQSFRLPFVFLAISLPRASSYAPPTCYVVWQLVGLEVCACSLVSKPWVQTLAYTLCLHRRKRNRKTRGPQRRWRTSLPHGAQPTDTSAEDRQSNAITTCPSFFLAMMPTEGWSVVAVQAWAGLVMLEPPSLCRRLFDDEVAGAGLEPLLELARPGFEPTSSAAGVYAHNHSSTDERCSVWLP